MLNEIVKSCYKCVNAPCIIGCPLHHNIPKIMKLYQDELYLDAFNELFKNNPLLGICGDLCPHEEQCASKCRYYIKNNERIRFNEIEKDLMRRFNIFDFKFPTKTSSTVIIVGAGPAGLASAIRLRQNGFNVTLCEKENHIGGVVEYQIPRHRYDSDYLDKLEEAINPYINIKYNTTLGINLKVEDLFNYDYAIVACGAQKSINMINHPNVLDGNQLLKELKQGLNIANKKIAVLGCGHTALDVAECLKLLDNDVEIIYRRLKEYAPVTKTNLNHTLDLGISFKELLVLDHIEDDNAVLRKMKLIPSTNGSRPSVIDTDETYVEHFDLLVEAYGSKPIYDYFKSYNWFNKRLEKNWLKERNYQNLYFVGDYYNGPTTISKAINDALRISDNIIQNDLNLKRLKNDLGNKNVIVGGSFNPITIGHQEMIDYLLKYVTKNVVILPNGNIYPRKELLPFDIRSNLIKTVYPNIVIDDYETKQAFKGSIHYLEEHEHPFFVIGSDSLKDLPTWIEAEKLIKENNFIVFSRAGTNNQILIEENELLNKYQDNFYFINTTIVNVSSTNYRNTLDGSIVDPKIHEIVLRDKLYTKDLNN